MPRCAPLELEGARLLLARSLLGWLRIAAAARRLGDGQETVERVALSLGYASRPALDHACRHLLQVPPSEVRQRGGLRFAGARLSEAVQDRRAKAAG